MAPVFLCRSEDSIASGHSGRADIAVEIVEEARSIKDDFTQAEALMEVAGRIATADVDQALRIVDGLANELLRASALWLVAQQVAAADVDLALEIAEAIPNELVRTETALVLCRAGS